MDERGQVTVEFFGVPRMRAGRTDLTLPAGTVAELLAGVEHYCPGLSGLLRNGRLAPHYLLSMDGQQFVTDMNQEIRPGDRLLLLSADAGG